MMSTSAVVAALTNPSLSTLSTVGTAPSSHARMPTPTVVTALTHPSLSAPSLSSSVSSPQPAPREHVPLPPGRDLPQPPRPPPPYQAKKPIIPEQRLTGLESRLAGLELDASEWPDL